MLFDSSAKTPFDIELRHFDKGIFGSKRKLIQDLKTKDTGE